jgi:hypothetical protein
MAGLVPAIHGFAAGDVLKYWEMLVSVNILAMIYMIYITVFSWMAGSKPDHDGEAGCRRTNP